MTQEDKQLLLQDLCARLPYGVKAQVWGWDEEKGEVEVPLKIYSINTDGYVYFGTNDYDVNYLPVEGCRLLLRPLSSMTEEEREDFWKNVLDIDWRELEFDKEPDVVPFPFTKNDCGFYLDFLYLADLFSVFDWLNAHHFDFRNLLAKGLAIEVTEENNPYKD